MADKQYTYDLYGPTNPDMTSPRAYGWWRGGGATIVWANLVWVLVIIGWTGFWMVRTTPFQHQLKYMRSC